MDRFKAVIDAYDKLLDEMEKTSKEQLSPLQQSDLIVYTEKHLTSQLKRLTSYEKNPRSV